METMEKQELKLFNKMQKRYREGGLFDSIRQNLLGTYSEILFKDYTRSYFDIVEKISKLIKELNISSIEKMSIIITYLIWNGYLSLNKDFVFQNEDRINKLLLLGLDVINGKGVCLNIASILKDILCSMERDAHLITCRITNGMISKKDNLKFNIDRNKSQKHNIITEVIGDILPLANHAVVSVSNEDGKHFIIDPTNLRFMNYTSLLKAAYLGNTRECSIYPFSLYFLEMLTKEEMTKYFLDTYHSKNVLNEEEALKYIEQASATCEKNKALFDDFHDEVHDEIENTVKCLRMENKGR